MENRSQGKKNSPSVSKRMSAKKRTKSLIMAADSAISRLGEISRPGSDIDSMDIKELKSLISSIKDLADVSAELSGEKQVGGVVILPEVSLNE